MSEKIFAKGIYYNKPRAKAPDYVFGSLSVKLDDFMSFAGEHVNADGFVNLDILAPKDATKKPYMTLNTYVKPADEGIPQPDPNDYKQPIDSEDIPF